MEYGYAAEIDHTIGGREFSRIGLDTAEIIRERLSKSALAKVDLELIYCPILMHERYRIGYPARSRFSKKKGILNCSPQLEYEKYIASDQKIRRQIYLTGLLSAATLMKRAGMSNTDIQEFTDMIEDMIN